MRTTKEDIPVRIDVPGATARQKTGFGDVTGYGKMGAEYFPFGAGTDITELLRGLEGDMCQSPPLGLCGARRDYGDLHGRRGRDDANGRALPLASRA